MGRSCKTKQDLKTDYKRMMQMMQIMDPFPIASWKTFGGLEDQDFQQREGGFIFDWRGSAFNAGVKACWQKQCFVNKAPKVSEMEKQVQISGESRQLLVWNVVQTFGYALQDIGTHLANHCLHWVTGLAACLSKEGKWQVLSLVCGVQWSRLRLPKTGETRCLQRPATPQKFWFSCDEINKLLEFLFAELRFQAEADEQLET